MSKEHASFSLSSTGHKAFVKSPHFARVTTQSLYTTCTDCANLWPDSFTLTASGWGGYFRMTQQGWGVPATWVNGTKTFTRGIPYEPGNRCAWKGSPGYSDGWGGAMYWIFGITVIDGGVLMDLSIVEDHLFYERGGIVKYRTSVGVPCLPAVRGSFPATPQLFTGIFGYYYGDLVIGDWSLP